jgi:nitrate/nitrite transport system substrate-binding protein
VRSLILNLTVNAKPDAWYMDMAKKVFRSDIYQQAAKALIAEGKLTANEFPDFVKEDGYRPPQATSFIDGVVFDGKKPNAYLDQFKIGLKGDKKL